MNNFGVIYYMSNDDICKYLGAAVMIVFLVYIGIRSLRFQANIIEGLTSNGDSGSDSDTDKTKIADAVKANTAKIEDTTLISKYRSNYEDTIIALESNTSESLVAYMMNTASTISTDPSSVDSQKSIVIMNNLASFRHNIQHLLIPVYIHFHPM